MTTIQQGYETTQGIDPAILNDPELIRKRKEARRNMTAKERQEMLTQAGERAFQEAHEQFVQEGIARWRKQQEAKERQNKETDKPVESADK